MPGMNMEPGHQRAPADTAKKMPGMKMDAGQMDSMSYDGMDGMGMDGAMQMPGMSHAYSWKLPMSRNGSGTSWHPDQTPMYMWMQHKEPWMLMYHGAVFGRYLDSALVWGMNQGRGAHAEHAALAETNLTLGRPTFYGRYEFVQKDSEELNFYASGPNDNLLARIFNVHALTLGSSYHLTSLGGPRGPELSVGGQLTGYFISQELQSARYGVGYIGPGYGRSRPQYTCA